MATPSHDRTARESSPLSRFKIAAGVWTVGIALLAAAGLTSNRPARAVPAFAQQTGNPCKSCHVGGFGPELTPHGREFKLGGYTMREMQDEGSRDHGSMDSPSTHGQMSTPPQSSTQNDGSRQNPPSKTSMPSQSSTPSPSSTATQGAMHGPRIPLAAMAITSFTHATKDQIPPPEHLSRNNNLVLDEAALFLAGGFGKHFGAFAEVTYDGVERHFSWDNVDLRAVTETQLGDQDATFGLSLNNSPTVQDPWNTLPTWGFPFTDTAVSPTPSAAPLIDDALAQNVVGLTGYGWIAHKFYIEVGGYSSPSSGLLRALGADPKDPGSIHGIAPYARVAFQTDLGGGTFEVGASALKAALFPERDRSSRLTDRYTDLGLDTSWQKTLGSGDLISANLRYEHERANLRASCALGLIGSGSDAGCARYHLNEWRGAVRYTTLRDKLGLTLSPFSITGSRNANLFENGSPNSNGLMGQVDYTFWPDGKSPLGPLFNVRVGAQYTAYRKFDGRTSNASDNNALRLFVWVAY